MVTRLIQVFAAVLLLGACASAPQQSAETIEQRVQGRWDVVIAGDFQAAYQYFSPGLRETVSYESYLRRVLARTVQWNNGRFREIVECQDEICKVRTIISYQVRGLVPGGGPFKASRAVIEDWIRVAGTWYFVPGDIL